jgi:CheY-like chemotaxis protein
MASPSERILVVEDNAVNQLVAQGTLEACGYRVDLADNGALALEMLERQYYDLILMDCQMPVLDGYQTTRRLRQLGGPVSDVPVVAMTANAMPGEKEKCLAAGMNDYITKPVNPDEFEAKVRLWLAARQQLRKEQDTSR